MAHDRETRMRLSALVAGLDGLRLEPGANADPDIVGLEVDSRKVASGALFAALKGEKADGADYAAAAVEAGAVAVLAGEGAALGLNPGSAAVLRHKRPRHALARLSRAFFGPGPDRIAAVTGTNGKTSVAEFTRQIWAQCGHASASLGTLGVRGVEGVGAISHTTPDPIALHRTLAAMRREGITHLALEASSHGLEQARLDGVDADAAGFTNLSRDHLDYHGTLEAYREAKLLLFRERLRPGGVAVVDADTDEAEAFLTVARDRGARILTVGRRGKTLTMVERTPTAHGQSLTVRCDGADYAIGLPLVGAFQVSNALVAAGLAIGTGIDAADAIVALARLEGAPGRLERVASAPSGAPVYVDYAHTPDALRTALEALRPHTNGRLVVVFGAGGDRDRGKRPLMGAAAHEAADRIVVTDDNPRSEDPAAIRRAVLAGCPGATEEGDRRSAIRIALEDLSSADVLLVAGKGHETGQTVGDRVLPFDDRAVAREEAASLGGCHA